MNEGRTPDPEPDFTVHPSLFHEGVVEVHFSERPTPDVAATLADNGFAEWGARWALRRPVWCGPATRLPAQFRDHERGVPA